MPGTKIQDETEVKRWFREGKTLSWMQAEYQSKYGITTSLSMWAEFRRRRGLDRRLVRDMSLIPWAVKKQHRWSYTVAMLRLVARQREGFPLTEVEENRVRSFLGNLEKRNQVVAYFPDTEEGFRLVTREATDQDIIRQPQSGLTERKNRDQA